jgi:hypothetical protein
VARTPFAAPPPSRDEAATRRSYAFLIAMSVAGWVLFTVAMTVAWRAAAASRGTGYLAAEAVATLALAGWVAFLGGLRRRDLARLRAGPPPP